MTEAPLVAVGEVLRPFGLRGELKVRPLTDRPRERFERLDRCVLWEPRANQREDCRIASCRFEGETVFVRMDGVDSPEAARRFQGRLLAVGRDEVLPLPEGQFYPWQMEGGVVDDEEHRQCLIPALPAIVVEVSVSNRRIVIDPPEGLLEL